MSKEIETGLSEDGQLFTIVSEDDSLSGIQSEKSGEGDPGDEVDADEFFDINSVPENQREVFAETYSKMKTALSEKLATSASADERLKVANSLLERMNAASSNFEKGKTTATNEDHRKESEVEFGFKFEPNDYYAPAFNEVKKLISELKASVSGIDKTVASTKQETMQSTVKKFVAENKITENPALFNKMNELSIEFGPRFVNNLPRILKLAKDELGIVEEKKATPVPSKVGKKRQVEAGGMRKSALRERPVESMYDAFELAKQQLDNREG